MLSASCCCYVSRAVLFEQNKNTNYKKKVVHTYEHKFGLTQKPCEKLLSTPAEKKTFEHRPRAQYCSDRAQTPTTASGQPSSAKSSAFARTARVRRDMVENRRKNHNYNYKYKAPLRGVGCPRGVTQAGMPQGKNYQSPSSGRIRVIPNVRNIYFLISVIPWCHFF